MEESKVFRKVKDAAKSIICTLTASDRTAVIAFSTDAQCLVTSELVIATN